MVGEPFPKKNGKRALLGDLEAAFGKKEVIQTRNQHGLPRMVSRIEKADIRARLWLISSLATWVLMVTQMGLSLFRECDLLGGLVF